jgi:L-amino acid N-acyltransferase YncA
MLIRAAIPADAEAMTAVLNAVIAAGGTTAHETPKTPAEVRREYIDGPDVLSSTVAEAEGRILGWQSVGLWHDEEHIGTFVQPGIQARGTGAALFTLTLKILAEKGIRQIFAAIRADNVPGLAYYARIGFQDIGSDPDFALQDGKQVGRVFRRFDL